MILQTEKFSIQAGSSGMHWFGCFPMVSLPKGLLHRDNDFMRLPPPAIAGFDARCGDPHRALFLTGVSLFFLARGRTPKRP